MKKKKQQKIKVTKIIDKTKELHDHIKSLETKVGRPKRHRNVLPLTDWLYITCDKNGWMVCEDGKPILYASTLDKMLMVAAHHMIKVPADYTKLLKHIRDIESLISARIPNNIKPRDLFKEMSDDE